MSHALPFPPSAFEELSAKEQIEYVETHLDVIIAGLRENKTIPECHVQVLTERLTRYRSQVEDGISWEEFEKELTQD